MPPPVCSRAKGRPWTNLVGAVGVTCVCCRPNSAVNVLSRWQQTLPALGASNETKAFHDHITYNYQTNHQAWSGLGIGQFIEQDPSFDNLTC